MSVLVPCLIRSHGPAGEAMVRVGVPLVEDYLEFLAGRCRPNTVLAAGYDLKVFFTVVGKDVGEIVAADVLAFITAQRTGRTSAQVVAGLDPVGEGGLNARSDQRAD